MDYEIVVKEKKTLKTKKHPRNHKNFLFYTTNTEGYVKEIRAVLYEERIMVTGNGFTKNHKYLVNQLSKCNI
jgi:hypothetical protein